VVPVNDYLIIQPVKKGIISTEDNEFVVIDAKIRYMEPEEFKEGVGEFKNYEPGDTVICEEGMVIRVSVAGKEMFFVKEENVLARIPGPQKND
jgi:hypothetical protein